MDAPDSQPSSSSLHKATGDTTQPASSSHTSSPSNPPLSSSQPSHAPSQRRQVGPEPSDQAHRADTTRQKTPSVPSSWSASSDRQLGHTVSPDPSDRVFPIRSVVSVDPPGRNVGENDYFPRLPDHGSYNAPRPSSQRVDSSAAEGGLHYAESVSLPAASTVTSPTDHIAAARTRRKNTFTGPLSSVQADATRQTTSEALPIFHDAISESAEAGQEAKSSNNASVQDALPDVPTLSEMGDESLLTTRFKHVVTSDGHAVITGRDGVLQRCEDEPIHTPGAVQRFGALLAIREDGDGVFTVRYASENSERLIGYSPQQLFCMPNFLEIMTEEQQDNLLDHIDFIRDEDADPSISGPDVFSLSVSPPKRKSIKLWCAIHINPSHPELIICEFELDDDREFPLRPSDEMTPDVPEDTLQSNPTSEELIDSTEILSKPLRVLRTARRRRGEAGAMQVFDIMSQVQEQLASAPNLDKFLKILVGIVKELTGFHRVMIYQFDSSYNGKVVTELVDPVHTSDLYKGLHFPASDIPRQARELYRLNKVRLLYDRDNESARLVCKSKEDLEVPLDMSHAYLRAMSPIHVKYLANMAVRSSMSISINAFNELWGLIACHSYGSKGMRVSFPIRKMCRLVGDTASRNIERLSYASRLQARKLINTAPTDENPSGYIIASSDDLLKLFDADFGMLAIQGETKILGRIDQSQEALAMLEYLRMRNMTSVVTSQDIREDFPDLRYPPGFSVIAGLLYVPLSVGGGDFIVFFRKGQVKEVKWAGNPYEKNLREGTEAYLEPRKSFKTWRETVLGKCREWTEEQVETAAVLCLVYGKFIEVWRQKEAALQSSKLTRLLLANSAHEVRTPLNAIINYLEIALEGTLDQETRDNLAKSHSASKSLIYVINDLLDLTNTEEGQNLIKDEIFDLLACAREATDPFTNEAKRKGIEYEVIEHPGLPRFVYGDGRRVRQVISNIAANAVQNTAQGSVKVELYVSEVLQRRVRVEIVVQDTGRGMTPQKLDALFRDLEQVDAAEWEKNTEATEAKEKPSEERILGLGLAVVARIVRNVDGQLRLKSEENVGSRFVVQLPFDLPDESPNLSEEGTQGATSTAGASVASVTKTLPPDGEGEITLVERGSAAAGSLDMPQQGHAVETASLESQKSITSKGSRGSARSGGSDAERLIEAIQTPLSLGGEIPGSPSHQRSTSKDGPAVASAPKWQRGRSQPESPSSSRPGETTSSGNSSQVEKDEVGFASVQDSNVPIRAVKVPDDYFDQPTQAQQSGSSRVLFEVGEAATERSVSESGATAASVSSGPESSKLQVLVAEDDPINMRILRKRLEKAGHQVHHAVNGEECASVYREKSDTLDVVLMDMQMPIVDGLKSTKMIRSLENSPEHSGHSSLASHNGRIPIFAVSASLVEREKDKYADVGFDGWILKPIDFKRLNTLLLGIIDDEVRSSCLYTTGEWERGGWFSCREDNAGISEGADEVDEGETPKAEPELPEAPPPDLKPADT